MPNNKVNDPERAGNAMTEKTKTEVKPLVLTEIIGGLEAIYDPNQSTIFDVSEICNVEGYGWQGQVAFLKRKLPQYVQLLNERSGCRVVKAEVIDPGKVNINSSGNSGFAIKLVINGRLMTEKLIDHDFGKDLSNLVKKTLATKVLELLSPEIPEWDRIPFAAGEPDFVYLIQKYDSYHFGFKDGERKQLLAHDELCSKIIKFFHDNSCVLISMEEIEVDCKNIIKINFSHLNDTLIRDCFKLRESLDKIVREFQILPGFKERLKLRIYDQHLY
jgi:hypothetical protein